ncbi:hypothetical protein [Bacillus sp. 3a]|nr:hypothetical protein [Bacillus sp. 3a]QSJ01545.1 hypothetical protein JJ692_02580 [Bacillus sp. 3a]
MLLPTQVSQLAEISNYREVPIFVTFDKGIKLLFDSLLVMGENQLANGKRVPEYSTKIFYSSGWKDADIYELCEYVLKVQRSKRKIVDNQENELIRINHLATKLEKVLMEKLKYKSHLD